MGFTKLDEGIVHSSIWSEALATRVLWVTMLAMVDSKGFVSSSRSGLLRAANIPQEDFDISLGILESPDPDSRSPEYDGKRVQKCDGGWNVLNYLRYREFTYSGSKEAIKKRKQRDKGGHKGDMSQKGGDISASASASSSSSLLEEENIRIEESKGNGNTVSKNGTCVHLEGKEGPTLSDSPGAIRQGRYRQGGRKRNADRNALRVTQTVTHDISADFEAFWQRYPRKEGKQDALAALKAALKTATLDEINAALDAYLAKIDQEGTLEKYIKLPATFLRNERWKDYAPKPKLTPEEFQAAQDRELEELRGRG